MERGTSFATIESTPVALMSKYSPRKFETRYKSKRSRKVHLRVPVTSVFVSVMIIFLVTMLPVALSSSSQTVVQDWTDNRNTAIGMFGAYQILPSGIVAPFDSEVGNCFTTPGTTTNTFTISDAQFRLNSATGMPAKGMLEVIIYNTVGAVKSSTCVPNTSVAMIGTSLGTTPTQIGSTTTGNITFSFETIPPQVVLQGNTTYAISVRLTSCSVCNTSNFWNLGTDFSNLILSFRVGSTSLPMSMSTSSSFSSYFWNGMKFVSNIQSPSTAGGGRPLFEM